MGELRWASSSRISEPSLVMNGGTSARFLMSMDFNECSLEVLHRSGNFRPIRLPDDDTGDNQNHRHPKRGRDRFMQEKVRPAHCTERNQVIEQHHLAGAPAAKRVVPKRVGNHPATNNAEPRTSTSCVRRLLFRLIAHSGNASGG